jgi:CO/xanthine dehydrogenase Mo-binding subunit
MAMPGVLAVLTAQDLGTPVPRFGPLVADQPVLAHEFVRFHGEPVAAVAATDEATARAALKAIEVDWEELPAVASLDAALASDAPLVVDPVERTEDDPGRTTNVVREFSYGWGELPEACDLVLENEYGFPAVHHYAIEPPACVAVWDASGLTVWSGVQHPFQLRRVLATTLRLPLSKVQVRATDSGGSFGGKGYPKIEPIVALLARTVGRPVKVGLSVEDAFHSARRSSARIRVRTGVDAHGNIRFQEVAGDFLIGAYADISLRVVGKSAYLACGPYRTPAARIVARAVASNTAPSTAFRGFGAPQWCWALESQMDELAHACGIDPLEFRLRNLASKGEPVVPGDTPADGDWTEGLRQTAEAIGWNRRSEPRRGMGLAVGIKNPIPATTSMALVRMYPDASVAINVGTTENGQGSRTVLAQIAAEALGVAMEQIAVPSPDTTVAPFDFITASSRSTTMAGNAVLAACRDLKEQLAAIATEVLGMEGEVDAERGCVVTKDGACSTYREIIEGHFGENQGEIVGQGAYRGERNDLPLGGRSAFWEVSFAASEIEVDPSTGEVRVIRHVGGEDVGRAINPALVVQQHHGAAVMGLGHTLFEELKYDDDGRLLNPNVVEYRVPLCPDIPEEFECVLIESGSGPGPYGARGVGESGTIPFAASVGNALFDATGVRVRELPLNPERVWHALNENTQRDMREQESSRSDPVEPSPRRTGYPDQAASDS